MPLSSESSSEKTIVQEKVIGVWQFSTLKEIAWNPLVTWAELTSAFSLFRRLALEIYALAPRLLCLYIFSKIWYGIESAVLLHLSSHLLQIIEVGLREGHVDPYAISMALSTRLSCVVFVSLLRWWCDQALPELQTRIEHHYEIYLMRIRLQLDLATAQEPDRISKVSAHDGWRAFDAVFTFFSQVLTSSSQLYFIFSASRSSGGPIFALLCMTKPMIHVLFSQNLWSKEWIIHANNPDYQRMNALLKLSGDRYRQDYIAGNIGNHILQEYEKAKENLGDTCIDDWWDQFHKQPSPYFDMFCEILGDLPMAYCAINAVLNPSKLSVASVAVLQHSSMSLGYSIQHIFDETKNFQRYVSKLKNLYGISEFKSKMQEGDLNYPRPDSDPLGMSFELRNVSFAYPGATKTTKALNDVSLFIKAGQLVVIVGANGSGKSTIIKLLTRLYDPSSGTLLVDSVPAQNYLASNLRVATASFTQDHKLYPLSLYENIGLGRPTHLSDKALVAKAAEEGGASAFITKLAGGLQTVLEPNHDVQSINVPSDPEHPLQKKMQMLQKELDISGGERQRVIASRTFMHLHSGQVKFVAVDEPSSALDAEGEAQLFDRLLKAREGKTMVFVTHRFAHLTKFADVILCMKDGAIAESGTHAELLQLRGEYSKLYDIQANAFGTSDIYPSSTPSVSIPQ